MNPEISKKIDDFFTQRQEEQLRNEHRAAQSDKAKAESKQKFIHLRDSIIKAAFQEIANELQSRRGCKVVIPHNGNFDEPYPYVTIRVEGPFFSNFTLKWTPADNGTIVMEGSAITGREVVKAQQITREWVQEQCLKHLLKV
jgi:hypothetical protein